MAQMFERDTAAFIEDVKPGSAAEGEVEAAEAPAADAEADAEAAAEPKGEAKAEATDDTEAE